VSTSRGEVQWPEVQRYDYLIRLRELTAAEAKQYGRLDKSSTDQGVNYPQRNAVLFALRELSGKDAGTTAAAWKKLLTKPASSGR
jgi:hypothetical protein